MANYEEIQFLLKRNWFLEERDIVDLLNSLNADDLYDVIDNVREYPRAIREVIYKNESLPVIIPCKDITNDDMAKTIYDESMIFEKKMDVLWEKYKLKHNLKAPVSNLQERVDSLQKKLDIEKSKLSLYKIPPTSLSKAINDLRNEIEELNNKIKKDNKELEKSNRHDFILREGINVQPLT